MVLDVGLTVGYGIAVVLGIATMLFGGRALSVLRRPPTGETGRELVFLSAEELAAPIGITLFVLFIEWVEWIVAGLQGAGLIFLPSFDFYANVVQGALLFVAAIMLYRVFIPYTRSRRAQRSRMILDRLAARVALLRGRK
jgi:hypothetical protein